MATFCRIKVIPSNWTVGINSSPFLFKNNFTLTLRSSPAPYRLEVAPPSSVLIKRGPICSITPDWTLLTWTILAAFTWLLSKTSARPSLRPFDLPELELIWRMNGLLEDHRGLFWFSYSFDLSSAIWLLSVLATLNSTSPPKCKKTGDSGFTIEDTLTRMTSKMWGRSAMYKTILQSPEPWLINVIV